MKTKIFNIFGGLNNFEFNITGCKALAGIKCVWQHNIWHLKTKEEQSRLFCVRKQVQLLFNESQVALVMLS